MILKILNLLSGIIGRVVFLSFLTNPIISFFVVLKLIIKTQFCGVKRFFQCQRIRSSSCSKKKGVTNFETEVHEWGEKRLSFDELNIDFYFEKNSLSSINYGKPENESTFLILPN